MLSRSYSKNAEKSAGQSVFHVHVHLIPRRDGDVDKPRGGVRHVVPCKGDYIKKGRMKYSETLTAGQAQPGYLRDNVAAKPQGS